METFDPIDYFKTVAITHKQIAHNAIDNIAFFREFDTSSILFDNSDFLAKMRKCAKTALIIQANEDGGVRGSSIDNKFRYKDIAIYLIQRVKITDFDEIEQSRKNMTAIWDDIYSLLQIHLRTDKIPPLFDLDVTIKSIGMIGDGYYGLAIFMNYAEKYCYKYNSSNWLIPN